MGQSSAEFEGLATERHAPGSFLIRKRRDFESTCGGSIPPGPLQREAWADGSGVPPLSGLTRRVPTVSQRDQRGPWRCWEEVVVMTGEPLVCRRCGVAFPDRRGLQLPGLEDPPAELCPTCKVPQRRLLAAAIAGLCLASTLTALSGMPVCGLRGCRLRWLGCLWRRSPAARAAMARFAVGMIRAAS